MKAVKVFNNGWVLVNFTDHKFLNLKVKPVYWKILGKHNSTMENILHLKLNEVIYWKT